MTHGEYEEAFGFDLEEENSPMTLHCSCCGDV
jgi:hypothetical protein